MWSLVNETLEESIDINCYKMKQKKNSKYTKKNYKKHTHRDTT